METVRGHLLQSRYYSNGVMNVGRGYMHGQGEAVLVDQNVDFYSFDFLSTVDAAFPAGRRRPARPAVRHEDRGIGIVAVDHPPPAEKIDQKALPETKAIPPREAGIHRREWYSCQKPNRAPLHAAVTYAPYGHDNLIKHLVR